MPPASCLQSLQQLCNCTIAWAVAICFRIPGQLKTGATRSLRSKCGAILRDGYDLRAGYAIGKYSPFTHSGARSESCGLPG